MELLKAIVRRVPIEVKYTLLLFITTRLALTLIGVMARISLEPYHGKYYVWSFSPRLWLDIWGVWDTGWYVNIATNGYSSQLSSAPATLDQANYAFFPLYPMLMHYLGIIIGDNFVSGIIVSNCSFIIGSIAFYRLMRRHYDEETALRGIKYLFLFPTAFILSGVFSESTFFMLLILCVFYGEQQKWILAGIAGFFLSLTRFVGVLVILPLIIGYLKSVNWSFKKVSPSMLPIILIPAGLLAFSFYNYLLTGDFLAFVHIQSSWGRSLVNPIVKLYLHLLYYDVYESFISGFTIIWLGLLIIFSRKLLLPYFLIAFLFTMIPLFTGVASMPRFLLVVFPIYIILAELAQNRHLDMVATIILAIFQGFLMVFWCNGFYFVV